MKRIISLILCVAVCLCSLPLAGLAADSFETSISAFPESYKVKLRELHKEYPEWVFTPLATGIDWTTVLSNELSGDRSLVSNYYCSDLLKSKAAGDYNASTDTYIQKDTGWVTANELAVSYFLDPRNFLNVSNMFQFETLSFSSTSTIDVIENILYGSFMYDKVIQYLDSSGTLITTQQKYSDVILLAGKTYNVNPCFLASKILNEVGSDGSASVRGTYSGYEGIYNFYNIGATDGSGAIGRGLSWASSGSTYMRPWTSPYRSILGGAEYLADKYIAKGQNTGYLQKFQVNPSSSYALYSHQYMTNVAGADIQGYSTYLSYLANGTLGLAREFIIPVFNNMPGSGAQSDSMSIADSLAQFGVVTASSCNVRSGPSTANSKLAVALTKGTTVQIIGKCRTSSLNYMGFWSTPYWYNVAFTSGGTKYVGYVAADYIDLTISTVVPVCTYKPIQMLSPSGDDYVKMFSSKSSVATVSGNSIVFKSEGTAEITAYTLSGGYELIRFVVDKSASSGIVSGQTLSSSGTNSFNLAWTSASGAAEYNFCAYNQNNVLINSVHTTALNVNTSGIAGATGCYFGVRAVYNIDGEKMYGRFDSSFKSAATPPALPTKCEAEAVSNGVVLSWQKNNNCTGFFVYRYNENTSAFEYLTKCTESSVKISGEDGAYDRYAVKAYYTFDGKNYCSAMTSGFGAVLLSTPVKNVKVKSVTANDYVLAWDKVAGAESYSVYVKNGDSFVFLSETPFTEYSIEGKTAGSKNTYKICANADNAGTRISSHFSAEYTAACTPDMPRELRVTDLSSGNVKLTWSLNGRADGFRIYTYDTNSKKYAFVKSCVEKNCVLPVPSSSSLRYAVCSYVDTTDGRIYSAKSASVSCNYLPGSIGGINVSSGSGSVQIKWSEASSATGYEVYVLNLLTGKFEIAIRTQECAYSVFGLSSGESLTFRIRAYCDLESGRRYSSYSQDYTVTAK